MAKNIILACSIVGPDVIAKELKNKYDIHTIALLSGDDYCTQEEDDGVWWPHKSNEQELKHLFNAADAIVCLYHSDVDANLSRITELSVQYYHPLICVAPNLTAEQRRMLQKAADYNQIMYWQYELDLKQPEFIERLSDIIGSANQEITSKIIEISET